MAVRLKDQDLTSQHQKMAKDFVQSHLYGPGTNRTTGKVTLPGVILYLFDHLPL